MHPHGPPRTRQPTIFLATTGFLNAPMQAGVSEAFTLTGVYVYSLSTESLLKLY
jgi:hypothetical protein